MSIWQIILLVVFIIEKTVNYGLSIINLRYLRSHSQEIPPEFKGELNQNHYKKIQEYSIEKTYFALISSVFNILLIIGFLFTPVFEWYNSWMVSLNLSFVIKGLLYFWILSMIFTLLDIPFDLYFKFKIENKYGFNTMTFGLWLVDFIKSGFLSLSIYGLIGGGALAIILASPEWWWLLLWVFFFIFSIFLMYIAPYVIEPLFYKFTPLNDSELVEQIKQTLSKTGIKVSRVFQMNASRRTRHSNAYFTGIGRVKRIVLFDTLLQTLTNDETVAVLSHEVAHWKKRHILKRIIASELISLILFYISYRVLLTDLPSKIFSITQPTFMSNLIVLGFIFNLIKFFFIPLINWFSRVQEREADDLAVKLTGNSEALASALVKLSKDNLSNLTPHPLYVKLYYSHPPVLERVRRLREGQI